MKVLLNDGEGPLDNNATEGSLRSFCLHKHAWKLLVSSAGARSSAIIYSITESAKANNLNSFRNLDYVLTVLKAYQDDSDYSFIEELLPWVEQLHENCRSKSKTTSVYTWPPEMAVKNEPVPWFTVYQLPMGWESFKFYRSIIWRLQKSNFSGFLKNLKKLALTSLQC